MMKIILSLFTLLITVSSCDSSKKAIENTSKMQEILSGTYYINQLGNNDVSINALEMTFDETSNKVTGFAGCNRFFGNYSLQNNTIAFNDIASSKKFCQKEIMSVENQLLKALSLVSSFSITEDALSFSDLNSTLIQATKTVIKSGKSAVVNPNYGVSVKYEALARNSFDFILISESEISISTDRSLQDINTYTVEAEDWEELNSLIEAIDLERFNHLKPPSEKHQFDGAAHATLAIIMGDVEYKTPTFDHGNPPKEIETLVNKVLSVKENTVKQ